MNLRPPFYALGEHLAVDLPGAHAVFTTRRGGVSAGPYTSLNLGRLTGDRPDAVQRNRETVQAQLDVRIVHGRQVHGAEVRRIADAGQIDEQPPESDGVATNLPGIGAMVLTADCLPIALAGDGAVAMLHGGWRGLAAGVVEAGVVAVRALGATGPLAAAIGPGAGGCCYEVGEEVHAVFAEQGAGVRSGRMLDLKAIARRHLESAGVKTVYDAQMCTICGDASLLFSHRRERGITGRQAGIAWCR